MSADRSALPDPRPSPVSATIDLEAEGARFGQLLCPWSRDDSAWGHLATPIGVIRRGEGPTALLIGGSHGDEYEGPIALWRLAAQPPLERLTGRILLIPALNRAAFDAARRLSPIDGANMNRIFPGRPDGSPSEKIAHYVAQALAPQADITLDIHSGGRTLDFLPFAACHLAPDPDHEARCWAAAQAFGAPYALKMRELDAVGMLDTTLETMGKTFVTTELRGGGASTAESAAVAIRGVRNLLIHAGVLAGQPDLTAGRSVQLAQEDPSCFHLAEVAGLLDWAVDLGAPLRAGDLIAHIHPTDRLGQSPLAIEAQCDGLLLGRRHAGLTAIGDCVAVMAQPV